MTILKVAQQGEKILEIVAALITEQELNSQWLFELSKAMLDTMIERNGVGIAAPQVFVSKRIIIVASRPNIRYPDAPEMQPIVMLNPEIIQRSNQQILGEEGCLSVPSQRGTVARSEQVQVAYLTLQGESVVQEFTGFPARIVQHEIDHLDGVLFVDRL